MKRITSDLLRARYHRQIGHFERRFPCGLTFRSETEAKRRCGAVAEEFDWSHLAHALLSPQAMKAFEMSTDAARLAYTKAARPAYRKHIRGRSGFTPADWKAYKADTVEEWAAYKAELAKAFAGAFWADPA